MPASAALGLAIRERRSQLGLSPEGVASSVGVDAAWLGRVEEGNGDPTLDRLLLLAEALDTGLATLFRRADVLARKRTHRSS